MAVVNNNIPGVHFPAWDQWPTPMPAASAAGSCICSDGKRYIYYLISATSFWRIDTWTGVPEQLANPTGGTVGAGTCMTYCSSIGALNNGVFYGSIFALITSGVGAPVYNRYDEALNTWVNLNVTNLPATFGTDGYLCFPEPDDNNFEGGYHTNALTTVTLSADIAINAVSASVTALPRAIPANTILNFGTKANPKLVHVTAAAAAAATSLTIAASINMVASGSTALYYDHLYLIGNNATQMYRFQITTSVWSTTSANSGNPSLPAITAAPGAGGAIRWLPGGGFPSGIVPADNLIIVRGGGTATIYRFDLQSNTMNTLTYNPATETFTTGSSTTVQIVGGKKSRLLITKEVTQKYFRFDFAKARKEPIAFQELLPSGAALVGDRTCIINQGGLDILYSILATSTSMVRTALWL